MVWKFYSGIVQFDKDSLILKSLMSDSKTDMLYKVQCAFESQQQIACDKLLELSEEPNSLCFSKNNFIPTDFLAMSYVIETSHNQVIKLLFKKCSLDSEGVDLFLDNVNTGKLDNIRYIGFNKKNCTVSEFKLFYKILCKIQNSLETLDVQSADINRPGITKLLRDFKSSNLSKLGYVYYDTSSLKEYLKSICLLSEICCGAVHYNCCFKMLSYCCNPINLMPKTNMDILLRCRKLVLISCGITDETLSELINISNQFVNVDTIHLDFNKLTFENIVLPSGADGVFDKICLFSAQCNFIQDSGAIVLAKALLASTSLETLDLQGNLITEECVKTLRGTFENIENFHLYVSGSSNELSNRQKFEEMCAIAFISIDMAKLEATFQGLHHVGELNLSDFINSSNEECLKYLKYCISLKHINLNKCLTPKGVTALAENLTSCTNLQTLSLCSNNMGSGGAAALAKCLNSCSNLEKLNLLSNNIGSDGATALAKCLKSCCNLEKLDLAFNCIGSDGTVALAKCLKNCSNLETLNLQCNEICSDGATALAKCLNSCSNLERLDLGLNNIRLDGAAALAECLKNCSNLETLNFDSNYLGSDGTAALAKCLKNCSNLKKLNLGFNNMGSDGAAALAKCLKNYSNPETLNLGSNNIGSDGAAALANWLKNCSNLRRLNLHSNNIGSDGAVALAECLKNCSNLEKLYLDFNNIGSDGAAALAESLKNCSNLKTLDLNSNHIGSDGAAALANWLKNCSNLQTLILASNNIGFNGAIALADCLKNCSNLQMLNLDSNSIDSGGATALTEGLMSCNNLEYFYLRRNKICSIEEKKIYKRWADKSTKIYL